MNGTEYRWKIEGSGGDGSTFVCEGVASEAFPQIFHTMMGEAFQQLTSGRAQFGNPGKGCSGPYKIKRVTLEERTQ